MKKVFLSMLLTIGVFGLALGQQSSQSSSSSQDKDKGWEKIGEKTVNLSENHGIFNWNTDREKSVNADEKYSAIKFKAKDAPVDLTNVEVQYDNGKKQDLSLNSQISTNSESKALPLNSQEKLDKVTFSFNKNESASAPSDKAKVEIWGLKASAASGMGQGSRSNDMDKDKDRDNSSTSTGIDSRSNQDQTKRSKEIEQHSKDIQRSNDIERDTMNLHSK